MNRRKFIIGSSTLAIASILPTSQANAFLPCLARMLFRSAGGRHMLRFGRSRVRYGKLRGYRTKTYGKRGVEGSQRKKSKAILVKSKNARLFKEIGELVLDNLGNNFPSVLNGNITACSGGYEDEVYCGTFPALQSQGKPIIMELCELQMLDEVGKRLPDLYRKAFGYTDETASNREILSYLHPIAHFQDGQFGNNWDHYSDKPLIYRTARGVVHIDIVETEGKCIIERDDGKSSFEIPVKWTSWNKQNGRRV